MVAISSVGSHGFVGTQAASTSTATAAGTAAQNAPTQSSSVTLGQNASAPPNWPTYTVPGDTSTPLWEHAVSDAISLRMAGNITATGLATRFGGLGEALLSQIAKGGGAFSQSVIQPTAGGSVEGVVSSRFQAQSDNQISLTIGTRSGATVAITLGSDGDRLRVQTSVAGGELTDGEREALGKLSAAFQKSVDALSEVPPRVDVSDLMQYDATQLSSVKLQASIALGKHEFQTLDFQADDKQRSLTAVGPTGTVKLKVDTTSPAILGTAAQQAKAISAYLKQFDDAKGRGQGDAALMSMFKDAFSALHSQYGTGGAQQSLQSPVKLSAGDHGMLTGLADFSASISQTAEAVNPLKSDERDTFDYQVSQSTQVQGTGQSDRGATQQQASSLDASYHRSLYADTTLSLTESPYSQSYFYDQIHDKASSRAEFSYDDGKLAKATLTQSADLSRRTQQYMMGRLESDTTTPVSKSNTVDVLSLVKAAEKEDGLRRNDDRQEQQLLAMHDRVLLQPDPAQIKR